MWKGGWRNLLVIDHQTYGIITVKNLNDEDGELLKRARAHGHPDWRNRGMTVEGNLK